MLTKMAEAAKAIRHIAGRLLAGFVVLRVSAMGFIVVGIGRIYARY